MRLAFVLLALVLFLPAQSRAAEPGLRLVMFQEDGCMWCERWRKEVGVIYSKTEEGQKAPLMVLDIADPIPTGFQITTDAQFTPTFVLLKDGVEQGRIIGYPGEDFFWGLLDRMLKQVADGKAGS